MTVLTAYSLTKSPQKMSDTDDLDDLELLKRFRDPAGKNYAFNLIVRKYQQRVYFLVRKMVIDHDDADDLVQEIFIKVWDKLDGFKENSKLFTWIYRVATNECLNFLEKKKRRFFIPLVNVQAQLLAKLDAGAGPTGDEIALKLQKAVLTLPEKQRLVFHMKYFEEMTYEEISEVVQTSVGALKASYHHAVKKIEAILCNDEL